MIRRYEKKSYLLPGNKLPSLDLSICSGFISAVPIYGIDDSREKNVVRFYRNPNFRLLSTVSTDL